jgi:hypothetical protein
MKFGYILYFSFSLLIIIFGPGTSFLGTAALQIFLFSRFFNSLAEMGW